jgi:Glycosyltransferase family 87
VVIAAVGAAVVVLLASGVGMSSDELALHWQLLDIGALEHNPFGAVWYLHTQPPGYNLLVGLVAWSPLPLAGTLYALNVAALAGTGLLIHDLLVRWGTGPVVAGVVAAAGILSPSLVSAMHWGHYEVLVAFLLVAALWCAQRFLDGPRPGLLVAVAGLLTLCGLVRSLFHPVWIVAAVVVLALLRRVPRRHVVAALAVPIVLLGGWMLKNAIVFDTATTSSWLGFNLQRGVVAAMQADDVEDAVATGRVSSLAHERPWAFIEDYRPWVGACRPTSHPVTARPEKPAVGGQRAPNFNHECYLPVYEQALADATQLVRDHPARYVATRTDGLLMSFQPAQTGLPPDETLLDRVYRPALLVARVNLHQDDWNIPFGTPVPLDVSFTLLGLAVLVVARGTAAGVRLARLGVRWSQRASWPAHEIVWALVAVLVLYVVVGGTLVEFGENGRFRSSLDPLLIALPLAWAATAAQNWWRRRSDARDVAAAGEVAELGDDDPEPVSAGARAARGREPRPAASSPG